MSLFGKKNETGKPKTSRRAERQGKKILKKQQAYLKKERTKGTKKLCPTGLNSFSDYSGENVLEVEKSLRKLGYASIVSKECHSLEGHTYGEVAEVKAAANGSVIIYYYSLENDCD